MLRLDLDGSVPFWRPEAFTDAVLAFSTRRGGVSPAPFDSLNLGRSTDDRPEHVETNRRLFLSTLSVVPARLATAGQVHGTRVVEVHEPGHTTGCDALVSTVPGLALAVTAADCMPIIMTVPGAVAVAHSGWRGTAEGLPAEVFRALVKRAGTSAGLQVSVGPCIRGCCYEVGADVARRFPAAAVERKGPSFHLDLVTAARIQLLDAGIAATAINDTGACTSCQPGWYFSHRRDAGRTGRQWGAAAVRPRVASGETP
jgi:purine-nucleoside/S-methyl-5'-thioadenosine phosphorylase / adenosine deaminase